MEKNTEQKIENKNKTNVSRLKTDGSVKYALKGKRSATQKNEEYTTE